MFKKLLYDDWTVVPNQVAGENIYKRKHSYDYTGSLATLGTCVTQ